MKQKNNISESLNQKSFNYLKNYKVTLDTALDANDEKILFPEKLKKANETLRKAGLPKEVQEEIDKRKKEKE